MKNKSLKKYLKDWKVGPLDFWDITFMQAACIAFGMFLVLVWDYTRQLEWYYYLIFFLVYFFIAAFRFNKKTRK